MATKHAITKITALPYPRIGWVYNPATGRGPLHIARQRCTQNGSFRSLAECGRAIEFQHYFGNGITKAVSELEGWSLCGRCGSRAEFEAAMEEFKTGHAKSAEKNRQRRRDEDRQRDIEYKARLARVERLKLLLKVERFINDKSYLIAFEHEGYKYTVSEEGIVDEKESVISATL